MRVEDFQEVLELEVVIAQVVEDKYILVGVVL